MHLLALNYKRRGEYRGWTFFSLEGLSYRGSPTLITNLSSNAGTVFHDPSTFFQVIHVLTLAHPWDL